MSYVYDVVLNFTLIDECVVTSMAIVPVLQRVGDAYDFWSSLKLTSRR